MNKEQKAAVVDEVAAQIEGAEAVLAVDYRGISVPQAAELRQRLNDAGARFRVVKNTLTIRAAEKAGAEELKGLLEGPTAFTFVSAEGGDVALAAKALSQFRREHEILDFKGGRMNGEPLTVEQLQELIAGLAVQLGQIAEQGLVGGEAPAEEAAAEDTPQEAEQQAEEAAADSEAEESAGEETGEEPSTETDTPSEEGDQTPSEGEEEEKEG